MAACFWIARLAWSELPAGDLAPMAFSRLHRRAVTVNITIFLTGALALALHLGSGVGARGEHGRSGQSTRVMSEAVMSNPSSRQVS